MNINSKFNLHQEVCILPLSERGIIRAFYLTDEKYIKVSVRYFDGKNMKEEYFYESELDENVSKEQSAGFHK